MPTPKQPYTDNFDILVALITYLSNTDHEFRLVPDLAIDLSLDERKVRSVVEQFPAFFRKSEKIYDHGEHSYTVHLRYARRTNENLPTERLKPEELSLLLDLVSKKVAIENEMSRLYIELKQKTQTLLWTNIITMIAALIAALVAITTAFIRK